MSGPELSALRELVSPCGVFGSAQRLVPLNGEPFGAEAMDLSPLPRLSDGEYPRPGQVLLARMRTSGGSRRGLPLRSAGSTYLP